MDSVLNDKNTHAKEASVLGEVVSSLASLDHDARVRIFRTLATFFDLSNQGNGQSNRESLPGFELTQRISSPTTPSAFSEDRTPTAKAFLLEKRPLTDVERVTCLAYYLTHYRDQPYFKTLDLSKLNTEAAQVKFSNPAGAVDNAAATNYLISAGQGKKQLSAIGEVYVQALPDRAAARLAISEVRAKKNRPKSKARAIPADNQSSTLEKSNGEE